MRLPDPRTEGSGNPGASNVLRIANRNAALIVLIGDILKGMIAIAIAAIFGVHGLALGLVGIGAMLGHIFPVFFQFKGGKGVATTLGVLLALSFWVGVLSLLVWLLVALILRYASVASMCMVIAAVIFTLFLTPKYLFAVLLMALIVIAMHHENITRLMQGKESKIELKGK